MRPKDLKMKPKLFEEDEDGVKFIILLFIVGIALGIVILIICCCCSKDGKQKEEPEEEKKEEEEDEKLESSTCQLIFASGRPRRPVLGGLGSLLGPY